MNVVPAPWRYDLQPGPVLVLGTNPTIGHAANDLVSASVAIHLASALQSRWGLYSTIQAATNGSVDCAPVEIHLSLISNAQLRELLHEADSPTTCEEGYVLDVSQTGGVWMAAAARSGLFYAVQTLLQLGPVARISPDQRIELPAIKVLDAPRFSWRGVLLDVGRHFYEVAFVRSLLDLMAAYKFNRFHWHLTDDQGWRIEVKSYPRLTEVGAWRGEGAQRYGGFYTQEEIRGLVAYAAERCIEVVAEIELPGHCSAALAAYPQLGCTQRRMPVPTEWGIKADIYCAGRENTFDFLYNVLEEVLGLFPASHVHIGGDEVRKIRWRACRFCQHRMQQEQLSSEDELQSYFVARVSRWLEARGKRMIGWDEILQGGLCPGATVMSWRGISGGIVAARAGHDVIMTPTTHCYFDYRQANAPTEPGAGYATLTLRDVYDFDPVPSPERVAAALAAVGGGRVLQALAEGVAWPVRDMQLDDDHANDVEDDDEEQGGGGSRAMSNSGREAELPAPAPTRQRAACLISKRALALQLAAAELAPTDPEPVTSGVSQPQQPLTPLQVPAPLSTPSVRANCHESCSSGDCFTHSTTGSSHNSISFHTSMFDDPVGWHVPELEPMAISPHQEQPDSPCRSRSPSPDPDPECNRSMELGSQELLPDPSWAGGLTPEEQRRILGGQANLWTEYVEGVQMAQYMLLPRLPAMAEALWSPLPRLPFTQFRSRLANYHVPLWRAQGLAYRPLDPEPPPPAPLEPDHDC